MTKDASADGGADRPLHLVFMGVSGSGKSTVAQAVRERLGWEFAEGDDFHPPANVAKMREGRPLTDSDRWGWLESLADWTAERDGRGEPTIITCSALRKAYRDVLRRGGEATFFVHCTGDKHMFLERMSSRDHFMPPSLLESQLDTLEPLQRDEQGMDVDPALPVDRLAALVLARLDLSGRPD
ncbi:gluconokinase [Nocardioides sp. zg-1308]|uniref:gluconokinase n=1 Tax=Nocardioides sp. zg-1308 TaxID=2736253 RepID=UPI001553CC4F|nr:gluconokinase [Nocardioides sp. zg-1308]NPD03752.1 gluconokinase [Nocardioides sp. zg-1308]